MPIVTAREPLPTSSAVAPSRQPPPSAPPVASAEAPIVDAVIAEKPREEALSPKFAALMRREKEITRRTQQFAAEKKAFEEERGRYSNGQFIPKSELDSDLLGSLSKYGYSYDQVVNQAINQPSPFEQELKALRSELAELKGGQTKVQTDIQERQKLEYDQAVNQIRNDATAIIASDPSYETIKESGSTEAVVRLIEKTFEDNGVMLSIEDAAAQVEEYLIEESLKVANYQKVRARLNPPTPPTEAIAPTNGAQKLASLKQSLQTTSNNQLKTLTNAATATPSRPRTERERRERALAILRGEKLT